MAAEALPEKENLAEPIAASATMPLFIPAAFRDSLKRFCGSANERKRQRFHGAALGVYLVYVSRANKNGIAWPRIDSLCFDTGLSRNAVKAARKMLIEMGLLEVVKQERKQFGMFGKIVFRVKNAF